MTPGVPVGDLKPNTAETAAATTRTATTTTTTTTTTTAAAVTIMNNNNSNNSNAGNHSNNAIVSSSSSTNNNNDHSYTNNGSSASAAPSLTVLQEKFRVEGWLFVKDKDLVYSARSGSPVVDSRLRRVSRRGPTFGGDLQKSSSGVVSSAGNLGPNEGFSTLSNRDVASNGWGRYYCALHRGVFSHYSSEEQSLISDKVAIDFERVRLDGGPLRVYNPWYDKGVRGVGSVLLDGPSPVAPVPEEDEGCESEVSLESAATKDVRDRTPLSTGASVQGGTAAAAASASAASGKENIHLYTNGQVVTIRRGTANRKVDRATSPSISSHPTAVNIDLVEGGQCHQLLPTSHSRRFMASSQIEMGLLALRSLNAAILPSQFVEYLPDSSSHLSSPSL